MLYKFLQVSDELLDSRSKALAKALTRCTGRKHSQGDALHLILRLERYVVREANESAKDIRGELLRSSTFPAGVVLARLELATDWPEDKAQALLDALSDPTVQVLEAVDDGWRVRGLADRYAGFVVQRNESRGRAAASRLAKKHGYQPDGDGKWKHALSGETIESWEDVLAKLGGQQPGPDAQA